MFRLQYIPLDYSTSCWTTVHPVGLHYFMFRRQYIMLDYSTSCLDYSTSCLDYSTSCWNTVHPVGIQYFLLDYSISCLDYSTFCLDYSTYCWTTLHPVELQYFLLELLHFGLNLQFITLTRYWHASAWIEFTFSQFDSHPQLTVPWQAVEHRSSPLRQNTAAGSSGTTTGSLGVARSGHRWSAQ